MGKLEDRSTWYALGEAYVQQWTDDDDDDAMGTNLEFVTVTDNYLMNKPSNTLPDPGMKPKTSSSAVALATTRPEATRPLQPHTKWEAESTCT